MLQEVETEYKYLISNVLFQELLSKCSKKYTFLEHKLQANNYYDTYDNALNRSKITVRIRQHHNKMKLQIKRHRSVEGSMSVSDEFSDIRAGDLPLEDIAYNYKGYGLPCFESIRRARQRVQSLFPELERHNGGDVGGCVHIVININEEVQSNERNIYPSSEGQSPYQAI